MGAGGGGQKDKKIDRTIEDEGNHGGLNDLITGVGEREKSLI